MNYSSPRQPNGCFSTKGPFKRIHTLPDTNRIEKKTIESIKTYVLGRSKIVAIERGKEMRLLKPNTV